MDNGIIEKIMCKKEFNDLPKEDVIRIYSKFNKNIYSDEEKIKKTRDVLRKVYSVFTSGKLLNKEISNKKTYEEILKKHISTRERYDFYKELYGKILGFFKSKEIHIVDLGAGINGLSYNFFPKNKEVHYTGVEAVGQLSDMVNFYFDKEKISNKAKSIHESLFNIGKIRKILNNSGKPRIIFLFKVIDSLEMTERNYSKKLLMEIVPVADIVVVSFATKSLISGKSFGVKRYWFENFVKENFEVLEDFKLGNERYIIFKKR